MHYDNSMVAPEKTSGWYRNAEGIFLPSVTEVLGLLTPELSGWGAGIASRAVYRAGQQQGLYNRSSKEGITQAAAESIGRDAVEQARTAAADIGSELHSCAWRLLADGSYPASAHGKAIEQGLENLRRWYADTGPERVRLLAAETAVYGDGYAGTLDSIVAIDGKPGLLELKTSRELLPQHAMQAAAYRAAWNREGKSPRLVWAAVLRVSKSGAGYQLAMVHQRRAMSAFKAILKAYFAVRNRVYE